mmetsp:Transcript_8971/g.12347  ORF Transcript_8971/g.12347 Transcript_8971/m.12347 type:complete len:161 (-) Transcript_8971:99-581(-)
MTQFPSAIKFTVPYPPTKGWPRPFESPYIQLSNPESSLQYLKDPDDVVAPSPIIIRIGYPLQEPVDCKISSSNPSGFTRAEIARAVAAEYRRIYDEEKETSELPEEKVCDRNPNSTLLNRAQTNGKYGIWGHGLEDLVLHTIERYTEKNGIPVYSLGVDS